MQQIKLTEYTESYAVSIEDGLPEESMAVFFKTHKGKCNKGEFFKSDITGWFEDKKAGAYHPIEISKWHPATVDM